MDSNSPEPSLTPTPVPINPTPVAPPVPEQTNTADAPAAAPDAQIGSSDPEGVKLDSVKSGLSAYILKKWWLVILLVVLTVGTAFAAPVLAILIWILAIAYFKQSYESGLFQAFAIANGYSFQKKGLVDNQTGLIFFIGHSTKFSDIVDGTYRNWNFSLFIYTYTIGYGRGSQTYNRGVMTVQFHTAVPSFVLRRHRAMQMLEEEGESLRSNGYSQKLGLEGDFDKHFQVFIRPGTQIDVLTILAPDVMQLLLGLDKYEIELTTDGTFYVYSHGYIDKKQDLLDVYRIVEAIAGKIGPFTARQQELSQVEAGI